MEEAIDYAAIDFDTLTDEEAWWLLTDEEKDFCNDRENEDDGCAWYILKGHAEEAIEKAAKEKHA